jgi:hypothetical protein
MPTYRVQVIDADGTVTDERDVAGVGPDDAALTAVGEPIVRGAKGRHKVLRVRYYRDSTALKFP